MKIITNSLGGVMLAIALCGTNDLQAQGKSRGNRNDNPGPSMENNPGKGHTKELENGRSHERDFHSYANHNSRYDHDYVQGRVHDRKNDDRYNFRNDHHDRYITYRHHRHSHPLWAPAYGYRYNTRYVYYQDYNVYYDCHRDVFVTFTGRNWVVNNRIPDVMYRVDFRSARVTGVDYWDDDFDFYLTRRRPSYISISAVW